MSAAKVEMPSYEHCAEKKENGEPMTALEAFIQENEPVNDEPFREGLQAVIREVAKRCAEICRFNAYTNKAAERITKEFGLND